MLHQFEMPSKLPRSTLFVLSEFKEEVYKAFRGSVGNLKARVKDKWSKT
jgi:hypothetical protein